MKGAGLDEGGEVVWELAEGVGVDEEGEDAGEGEDGVGPEGGIGEGMGGVDA